MGENDSNLRYFWNQSLDFDKYYRQDLARLVCSSQKRRTRLQQWNVRIMCLGWWRPPSVPFWFVLKKFIAKQDCLGWWHFWCGWRRWWWRWWRWRWWRTWWWWRWWWRWPGEKKMQPILRLAATLKAESEQRTYPSTPRMANMALFR